MESVSTFSASWGTFLGVCQSFLTQLENRREYPNVNFCEYAVDRLELWISTISHLIEYLSTEVDGTIASTFIMECIANFTDLLHYMRYANN